VYSFRSRAVDHPASLSDLSADEPLRQLPGTDPRVPVGHAPDARVDAEILHRGSPLRARRGGRGRRRNTMDGLPARALPPHRARARCEPDAVLRLGVEQLHASAGALRPEYPDGHDRAAAVHRLPVDRVGTHGRGNRDLDHPRHPVRRLLAAVDRRWTHCRHCQGLTSARSSESKEMNDSYPATMTASVLVAPRTVELREVEVPPLGPRQVLVRVEAVGVCGSDTHFYESGRI